MVQKVQYIAYLKSFSCQLQSILKKIDSNKAELTEQDRDIIKITIESFLKLEKQT